MPRSLPRLRHVLAVTACAGAVLSGSAFAQASGTEPTGDGDPIHIILMWEVKGESDYGIDTMQHAAELALERLDEAGGIDGRPVVTTRIPASVVDVQTLNSQFLEAEGMDPDLIIGFVAPSVAAIERQITAAGIPVIGLSTYPLVDGLPIGSEWMFQLQTEASAAAESFVEFASGSLGATDIAVLHTDESYGTSSADTAAAAIEADPALNLVTNLGHATTADDFTHEVQAAGDADVILNYSYPNPLSAQIRAFHQAELDIPTISGIAASTAAGTGLIPPDQLPNLYGMLSCNPSDGSRPPAGDFITAYTDAYGTPPELIGMLAYDAINLAADAFRTAASTEPGDVATALRELTFTDGACAPEWKADAAQVFNHQQVVVTYDENGMAVTQDVVEVPAR